MECGFVILVDHGLEPLAGRIYDLSKQFHTLSSEEKTAILINTSHRGYLPLGSAVLRDERTTKPNYSDSFFMQSPASTMPEGCVLAGPNQWPPACVGFREAMESAASQLEAFARGLLPLIAAAIGAHRDVFQESFDLPQWFFRLIRYPSPPDDVIDHVVAAASHTDYGFITLLFQHDFGGLQVAAADDVWMDVPVDPHAIVLNVGDLLQRWSNGVLKSCRHRVEHAGMPDGGRERFSSAFFFNPHFDSIVRPLEVCVTPTRPCVYDAVVSGEHMVKRIRSNYTTLPKSTS